jgi:DNA-directed RNA polymerase subunit RPC12/RpoP
MAELDGEIGVFNVCPNCGQYSEEKEIDPHGPFAICPYCGYRHRFVRLPLFVITGASASGKTTVCLELATQMRECVFMETDILWRSEFADPEDNWHDYRNMWLRVAKNISQAGRPVVLCGSARPEQFESCPERRYFTTIHYLAMVCEADELTKRLQSRPRWRASSRPEFIKEMLAFNAWFKQNAASTQPPMDLLDTTELVIQETCRRVQGWISSLLPESDE